MVATHPAPSPALIAQILGQLAFGLLAMTLCIPSMAEWGSTFDTSQAMVQLTFSGYVAAYGLLQLVYGPLSDRLGRRREIEADRAAGGLGHRGARAPGRVPHEI